MEEWGGREAGRASEAVPESDSDGEAEGFARELQLMQQGGCPSLECNLHLYLRTPERFYRTSRTVRKRGGMPDIYKEEKRGTE